QRAVRADDHQAVEAGRPGIEWTHGDANTPGLRAAPLSRVLLLRLPAEELGSLVERFTDECAGHVALFTGLRIGRSERCLPRWRVDAPYLHLVDSELPRGLADDRIEDPVHLLTAGRTLGRPGRRVREHGDAAPATRHRVQGKRGHDPDVPVVALRSVGPAVLDGEDVDRGDAPVLAEADTRSRLNARTRAPDEVLFLAGYAHHHRLAGLLREQCRDRHRLRAGNLAAEAAAGELTDQHDVFRLDPDPSRDVRHGLHRALRRTVQMQLAVLPRGHRRPRLERLMRRRLGEEGLVEDEIGLLESGVEVAEAPLVGRLAHGQPRVGRFGEDLLRPLERFQLAVDVGVPLEARVRPARPQAVERIDGKGQWLEI